MVGGLWKAMLACIALAVGAVVPALADMPPVRVGISAEFGVVGSTSAQAVRMGAQIAADEVNAAGGVLGGRRIEVVVKDDRSVPARAIRNLREFAADPDVVAVLCGKYSPVVVEALPEVHRLGLPLLVPWAAADPITEHGFTPDYVFRLSMRDSWAMRTMAAHALERGVARVGLLLPNTEWGRSGERAIRRLEVEGQAPRVVATAWYNWGEASLLDHYQGIRAAGAELLILLANEREGALLVREMAALPQAQRLPVLSHWGITGGTFVEGTGAALRAVDVALVQTYSFIGAADPIARRVVEAAVRRGVDGERRIPSPVGVAHAYDLVHILAKAVGAAGSADRAAVRDALENVRDHQGLVAYLERPFAPGRHDALSPEQVFLARFAPDGAVERIGERIGERILTGRGN
ncbi:MAG TPA: ABC transporter substrate-binding protein [Azospirillum sp.]|nr:ABC transporter substrate-binding protein [Azospirillum sp.]